MNVIGLCVYQSVCVCVCKLLPLLICQRAIVA